MSTIPEIVSTYIISSFDIYINKINLYSKLSKLKISSDRLYNKLTSLLASRRYVKELRSPAAIGPGIRRKVRYIGIPLVVLGIGFDRQR